MLPAFFTVTLIDSPDPQVPLYPCLSLICLRLISAVPADAGIHKNSINPLKGKDDIRLKGVSGVATNVTKMILGINIR